MFTGIAEEIGKVTKFNLVNGKADIEISCKKVLEDLKNGDSIMTDGVCLTVTDFSSISFKASMMEESLKVTKFDKSILGKKVNLERALKLGARLDGHLVQGHVDGIGRIISINNNILRIKTKDEISKYIVKKGSICIDGISLTVSYENGDIFEVSLIPETLQRTNLSYRKINDLVNLETDIVARCLEKLFRREERMDRNFLLENGFF
ncbi:MAG: riboflavin synthase [Peptoniphilaceae bacterium]|nr:riboflavin synthase [Peptoniphilaceae bacterium]MDY6019435.1 riboflavin synthase [Anaerococcus sp.]